MAKSFSKGSGNETRYNALARQTRGGGDRGGRGGRGGDRGGRGGRGGGRGGRGGDRGGRGGRGGDRGGRGGDRGGRGGGGGGEEREGRIGNRPGKKVKRVKASDFDGQSFYGRDKKIMFDREKRVEFVTGFKKRKDERREYAKQAMKEEAKQDRKETERVKQQQRQTVEEQYEQLRQLKRAESGLPPEEMTDNEDADESENGDLENQSEKADADAAILSDGDGGMFEKE